MTAKQLKAAREVHWRQDQKPILTLEEAENWFLQHPLCLFLPRQAQLPAPAPSFVEACLGKANPTPPHAAIEQAAGLLARLTVSGKVIALNLFGAVGEQPDFLVHAEALPFVVSLRSDRNWKHAPARSGNYSVSPLVVELWNLLEQAGPLTASAARERLGRELTEAALLRALDALWQPLRIIPVLQPAGQPALWELTQTHHSQALVAGSSSSQVTAISLLISMYLQSVYAATCEEIETFLSPLVSRSRIREAVRGLSATKQIHSLSMDAQTYYFLEDGLPEFAAEAEPEPIEPARRQRSRRASGREGFLPQTSRFPAPSSRSTSPSPRFASTPAATDPASMAGHDKPAGARPGPFSATKKWKGPRNYAAGNQRHPQERGQEGRRQGDRRQVRWKNKPAASGRNFSNSSGGRQQSGEEQRPPNAGSQRRSPTAGAPARGGQNRSSGTKGFEQRSWSTKNRAKPRGDGAAERPGFSGSKRFPSSPGARPQSVQGERSPNAPSRRPDQAAGKRETGRQDRSREAKSFARPNRNFRNQEGRFEAAGRRTGRDGKPGGNRKFENHGPNRPQRPAGGRETASDAPAKSPAFKNRGFKASAAKSRGFGPRSSYSQAPRLPGNPRSGKGNFRSRNAEKSKPKA